MAGYLRFAVAAALALSLAACASDPDGQSTLNSFDDFDNPPGTSAPSPASPDDLALRGAQSTVETPARPLQCVPYARNRSGINLYGDAATWWDRAAGHYDRASSPQLGAVLVLTGYAGPHRGHLAVVTAIDSPRQIRIDHANWMNDGRIYRNDPVVDVSADNDWSQVRVWDTKDKVLGSRVYPVRGFVGPGQFSTDTERLASQE